MASPGGYAMHEYPLDVTDAVDFAVLFSAPFLILDEIIETVSPAPRVGANTPTPSFEEMYIAWLN